MNCRNCSAQIPGEARFCPHCGASDPAPISADPPAPGPAESTPPVKEITEGPAKEAVLEALPEAKAEEPAAAQSQAPAQETARVCAVCGSALGTDAAFCGVCGTKTQSYSVQPGTTQSYTVQPGTAQSHTVQQGAAQSSYTVRPASPQGSTVQPGGIPVYPGQPAVKTKKTPSKTNKTILIVTMVLVLLVAGIFGGRAIYQGSRYNTAASLMSAGDYQGALDIYATLPEGYRETAANALLCRQHIDYNAAMALYNAGNYEDAKAAFEALGGFQDARAKAEECNSHVVYAQASALYAAGKYYEAYSLFIYIPGFQDADALAAACVQPRPSSSELYRDPTFYSNNVDFKIVSERSVDMYFEFYDADSVLVVSLYVRAGESVKVSMRPGTYTLRRGSGYDWFGTEDQFGDEGTYTDMMNPDDNTPYFVMEYNYTYEFTVRV